MKETKANKTKNNRQHLVTPPPLFSSEMAKTISCLLSFCAPQSKGGGKAFFLFSLLLLLPSPPPPPCHEKVLPRIRDGLDAVRLHGVGGVGRPLRRRRSSGRFVEYVCPPFFSFFFFVFFFLLLPSPFFLASLFLVGTTSYHISPPLSPPNFLPPPPPHVYFVPHPLQNLLSLSIPLPPPKLPPFPLPTDRCDKDSCDTTDTTGNTNTIGAMAGKPAIADIVLPPRYASPPPPPPNTVIPLNFLPPPFLFLHDIKHTTITNLRRENQTGAARV